MPWLSNYSLVIDTETLARKPTAVITELGIVVFRRRDFAPVHKVSLKLDIFTQLADGRTFEPETLRFHQQKRTIPTSIIGCSPHHAIGTLQEICRQCDPKQVWIQGPCFDRPIIEDFCEAYRAELPWHFGISRDTRSIFDVAFPGKKHAPRPHRALADAMATLVDLEKSLTELNRRHAA